MTLRSLSIDSLVAVTVVLYACLLFTGEGGRRDLVDAAMLAVACCGVVALRRYTPAALLAVALSLHLAQHFTDRHEAYTTVLLSIALFSMVAVARFPVGAVVWAGVTAVYLLTAAEEVRFSAAFVGSAAGFFASAWGAGVVVQRHQRTIGELKAAAALAEDSAAEREQMAVAEERNRLRDDLHDIVGHHVNVAAVLADAASTAYGRDDQRLLSSLDTIGMACRAALDEMEQATRWLALEPDVEPTPSLRDINQVIESVHRAGLDVQHAIAVTPSELETLDEVVSATATRFLREALTNVLKHSAGRWCQVEVRSGVGTLVVTVTSAAASAAAGVRPPQTFGGGSGLRRLRRRIELLGGTVDADSLDSVFRQQAIFPLRPRQSR